MKQNVIIVRVIALKGNVEERCVILGQYIIENSSTVRDTAKQYGVSKSTVHKDVSERLQKIQPQLHAQVKQVLEKNKKERHIRGGMATKLKYDRQREEKLNANT